MGRGQLMTADNLCRVAVHASLTTVLSERKKSSSQIGRRVSHIGRTPHTCVHTLHHVHVTGRFSSMRCFDLAHSTCAPFQHLIFYL